jgi:hypothetical protein
MNKFLSRAGLLPLYVVFTSTFGLSAFSKFTGGGTPGWFLKQFQDSILNAFPGALTVNFYFIAVLEGLTALGFLGSLIRLEFLPRKEKSLLHGALFLAMADFAILGFGLRLTGDYNGAFQLFTYFAATFLIFRFLSGPAGFSKSASDL